MVSTIIYLSKWHSVVILIAVADDNIQAVVDTESLKVMDGGSIQPPPTTVAAEDGDDDDENPDKPKGEH